MCYRTECKKCNKITWAGCGRHIDAALENVPKDQLCTCSRDDGPPEAHFSEVASSHLKTGETSNQALSENQHDYFVLQTSIRDHSDRVWQVALHPEMPLIASASADKTTRIYSRNDYRQIGYIEGTHKRSIRSCAWKNGESKAVLATASFDGTAGIWDCQGDEETGTGEWECAGLLEGHENEVKCVAWSASGTLLATCSRDKSIWVWDCENYEDPECLSVLQEHTQDVKCVAWHPMEELLASGSYDDDIRIWRDDGDDWICCATLQGHEGTVWSIAFEALKDVTSTTRLVSASGDSCIRIWARPLQNSERSSKDTTMPSILRPSVEEHWILQAVLDKCHTGDIYTVAWSPDTGRIASAGADGNIVIYHEKPTRTADSPPSHLHNLSYTATSWEVAFEKTSAHGVYEINNLVWGGIRDGKELLFSAGDDGVIHIWEVQLSCQTNVRVVGKE